MADIVRFENVCNLYAGQMTPLLYFYHLDSRFPTFLVDFPKIVFYSNLAMKIQNIYDIFYE